MREALDQMLDLMRRGGPVMWPLLALSVVGLALVLERGFFWLWMRSPGRVRRCRELAARLRVGDAGSAAALAARGRDVYCRFAQALLAQARPATAAQIEAAAHEALAEARASLERFMSWISTVITAAPMLGILGTVTGLMQSLRAMSDQAGAGDPRAVGPGIAEALITTAAGLVVALAALFPYNVFRAQVDRALSQLEVLAAAAGAGLCREARPPEGPG
jgi:biopolymer transport protein ExbB